MKYSILVFLSLVTASIAHAVPYELPTDSGWYQLQDSKTYESLCATGSGLPCDVPPGEYVLINHNAAVGQPDRRIIVRIGNLDQEPTIVYESKSCSSNIYSDPELPFNARPLTRVGCTVQCTVGMVTGGSCSASYARGPGYQDLDEFLLNTRTTLTEEGFACYLSSFPGFGPFEGTEGLLPAQFLIGLACLK